MNSKLTLALIVTGLLGSTSMANAGAFSNGDFETGDFSGWTQGGGYWGGFPTPPNPADYQPAGSSYNASGIANAIVSGGFAPNTDGNLNQVYSGKYSARINDDINNNSVSTIKQTVVNYTDTNIFFAWAAVLEASHGPTDSDNFTLSLVNETLGLTIYTASYNSATAPSGLFTTSINGQWFYTDWQVQNIDVSAYVGDTFSLTLLGADCPYGGHAGFVYLDGFGAVAPPPDPTGVPEPATLALFGMGLAGLAAARRRKNRA